MPARQQPTGTNASIEPRPTSAALAVVLPFVSRHRHPTSCWFVRHRSSPHRQFDVCSPVGQLALNWKRGTGIEIEASAIIGPVSLSVSSIVESIWTTWKVKVVIGLKI